VTALGQPASLMTATAAGRANHDGGLFTGFVGGQAVAVFDRQLQVFDRKDYGCSKF